MTTVSMPSSFGYGRRTGLPGSRSGTPATCSLARMTDCVFIPRRRHPALRDSAAISMASAAINPRFVCATGKRSAQNYVQV